MKFLIFQKIKWKSLYFHKFCSTSFERTTQFFLFIKYLYYTFCQLFWHCWTARNFEKGVERFSESRCKVWDCEMAPLEIYCYHRPLLHLFAWIRLSTTTPGCWKFSRQKRREEERRRKQAHIFSGTFEVCLIFCKIGSLKLSNVKRLSIRRQEICAELSYFFPFSTNDSFLIQKNWKEDSISDK